MKNYEETINSVLNRVNTYEIARKRRRKVITSTFTSMCSLCLVALLGIGIWKTGLFSSPPPSVGGNAIITTDTANPSNTEAAHNNELTIYLNQINEIASAAPLYLDPSKHYTANWNTEDVAKYIGVDLSNIGKEFKYTGYKNQTVTYFYDGTLVKDILSFSYQYEGSEFFVSVSKLSVPYDCIYVLDQNKKTQFPTKNGNVDVLFAVSDIKSETHGLTVADFEINGVFYHVKAENATIESFCRIINAILRN